MSNKRKKHLSADNSTPPTLSSLNDVPRKLHLPKDLHSHATKSYNSEGVIGGDDLAPSPIRALDEIRRKEKYKAAIDQLSDEHLSSFEKLVSGTPLAKKFGISAAEEQSSDQPEPPALWAERTSGREVTPADFIKKHYGTTKEDGSWDRQGLTSADISRCDRQLYAAYINRIRRHPHEDLGLPKEKRAKITDPADALEKRRATSRQYWRRKKNTLKK